MWAEYTTPSGFCCHSYIPRQPADQETIQIVVDLWQQNERLTTQEFWEAFDCQACTDWDTMQPDGTSFGGAWLTDRSNARELTRLQNFACLAKLQFPRRTILYAIDFLCPRRCESVIQSQGLAGVDSPARQSDRADSLGDGAARHARTRRVCQDAQRICGARFLTCYYKLTNQTNQPTYQTTKPGGASSASASATRPANQARP